VRAPGDPPSLGGDDAAVIAGQLGRTPRDVTGIAVRCRFGFPAVIETAPVLSEGSPNPTLLYLTCPYLAAGVSGIEARGGVRAFRDRCREDPALKSTVDEVTALYRARRAQLVGSPEQEARLEAGIGGPSRPDRASCLHAHAAAFLAVKAGWLAGEKGLSDEVDNVWARVLPGLDQFWCGDCRCARWAGRRRLAVIDVGTISVRLLVADVAGREVRDTVRRAEVTRLGGGLIKNGRLSPVAKERTEAVVRSFVDEARANGVESITLVGTSAARDARDGPALIRSLGVPKGTDKALYCGIDALVLTGEREAELTYEGASLSVSGEPVVLDVGGGSTELIHRDPGGLLDTVSLDMGAGRAADKWLRGDPPQPSEIDDVYQEARAGFDGYRPRFGPGGDGAQGVRTLVAVAGTVTTLACLDAGLEGYDRGVVHRHELSRESVRRLRDDLAGMTVAERAALPCVQAGRAPVIVAGATIVLAALDSLGFDRLTVSEHDLLDGLIIQVASQSVAGVTHAVAAVFSRPDSSRHMLR
jgi:exopolyphosphatase/guanosine-5'-triphosphate,3'-diphosphate pyrophosphatase